MIWGMALVRGPYSLVAAESPILRWTPGIWGNRTRFVGEWQGRHGVATADAGRVRTLPVTISQNGVENVTGRHSILKTAACRWWL